MIEDGVEPVVQILFGRLVRHQDYAWQYGFGGDVVMFLERRHASVVVTWVLPLRGEARLRGISPASEGEAHLLDVIFCVSGERAGGVRLARAIGIQLEQAEAE